MASSEVWEKGKLEPVEVELLKWLLESYCETLLSVKEKLKKTPQKNDDTTNPEYSLLSSAKADLEYTIEWLSTGRRPGSRRGVERLAYYQREILMDPQDRQFLQYASRANKIKCCKLSDEELALLTDLMETLTPREREVYTMIKGHGYSYKYVAEVLIISENSVKEYLKRAKVKLDGAINKELQVTMFL